MSFWSFFCVYSTRGYPIGLVSRFLLTSCMSECIKSSCMNVDFFHGSEMQGRVGILALYKLRLGVKYFCLKCSAIADKIISISTINYKINTSVRSLQFEKFRGTNTYAKLAYIDKIYN